MRLKTVSVDVDSRGHSCKEKMMSVLSEESSHSSDQRYFCDDFQFVSPGDLFATIDISSSA